MLLGSDDWRKRRAEGPKDLLLAWVRRLEESGVEEGRTVDCLAADGAERAGFKVLTAAN